VRAQRGLYGSRCRRAACGTPRNSGRCTAAPGSPGPACRAWAGPAAGLAAARLGRAARAVVLARAARAGQGVGPAPGPERVDRDVAPGLVPATLRAQRRRMPIATKTDRQKRNAALEWLRGSGRRCRNIRSPQPALQLRQGRGVRALPRPCGSGSAESRKGAGTGALALRIRTKSR